MRPSMFDQGFFKSFQAVECNRTQVQRRGVVRPQFVANLEVDERLLEPVLLIQEKPGLVGRIPMARIYLERTLKAENRFRSTFRFDQSAAEIAPEASVVRLEVHGPVEGL